MRIWTLHPSHLDPQGLVALWREALLARAVLRGATRGYRHQLEYEWDHLVGKLRRRSPEWYRRARTLTPAAQPSFRIVAGPVAPWERV